MIFNAITASLTTKYKKSIATKLTSFHDDGIALLWYLISTTDLSTTLASRNLKLSLQNLSLKDNKWDPIAMHNDFEETLNQITASGSPAIGDEDQIMYLIEAYKRDNKNEIFVTYIEGLENKWVDGEITTGAQLMARVVSKYQSMLRNSQWKVPKEKGKSTNTSSSNKTQTNNTSNTNASGFTSQSQGNFTKSQLQDAIKERNPSWKFDMTLSSGNTYYRNDKEYYKCTGPGHAGLPMWVRHTPGTCADKSHGSNSNNSSSSGGRGRGRSNGSANTAAGRGNGASNRQQNAKANLTRAQFKERAAEALQNANNYGDDISQVAESLARTMYDS